MTSKHGPATLTTYQKVRLQVVGYRAIQTQIVELLGKYDLNTAQWIILGWLYDNPTGMRISAVAEVLEVETPLITALMRPLRHNKHISIKTDPTDHRAKLATLTDSGVKLVAKLEPAMASHLALFDNSIRRSDMDSYFTALQNFIYASKRRNN